MMFVCSYFSLVCANIRIEHHHHRHRRRHHHRTQYTHFKLYAAIRVCNYYYMRRDTTHDTTRQHMQDIQKMKKTSVRGSWMSDDWMRVCVCVRGICTAESIDEASFTFYRKSASEWQAVSALEMPKIKINTKRKQQTNTDIRNTCARVRVEPKRRIMWNNPQCRASLSMNVCVFGVGICDILFHVSPISTFTAAHEWEMQIGAVSLLTARACIILRSCEILVSGTLSMYTQQRTLLYIVQCVHRHAFITFAHTHNILRHSICEFHQQKHCQTHCEWCDAFCVSAGPSHRQLSQFSVCSACQPCVLCRLCQQAESGEHMPIVMFVWE